LVNCHNPAIGVVGDQVAIARQIVFHAFGLIEQLGVRKEG
jgi:hypothetical protein